MRSLCVVALFVAACGSVSSHEDAGVDTVPPGSATLALEKTTEWVAQGDTTSIDFTITRGSSVTGALTVHVANLPSGLTAADVDVAAGATTGTIVFSATTASTVGSTTAADVQLLNASNMLDHRPFDVFVAGAHGTLDTTYGTAGVATLQLPDPNVPASNGIGYPRAIVQYPASSANAGKLVVAVELVTTGADSNARKFAIVRLNADGTVDTTFNTTGYKLVGAPNSTRWAPAAVALDSQERIVVGVRNFQAGGTCNIYVARFTSAGAVDTAFTPYDANPPGGYCGNTMDLKAIAGDKVIVLGQWNQPDNSTRVILVQLKADGTADTSAFNGSEAVRLPNPDTTKPSYWGNRLYLDSAGNYIIVGAKCNGGYDSVNNPLTACESVIGRVTPSGAWDTTFGTAGAGHLGFSTLTFGTTSTGSIQGFQGLAFDANGKMTVAGWSENYGSATLARWNADGTIDSTFGTSGRVTVTLSSGATAQQLDDVALDSTGRIVGIGYAYNGGPLAAATRYSAAGALDATFATAGTTTAPASALQTVGTIQLDGRILVVGATPRAGVSGVSDLAVWRFWP